MTSPQPVGEVSVDLVADTRRLIKEIKDDLKRGMKDLDMAKAIQDSVKNTKVKVGVDADTASLAEKIAKASKPVKVPVVPGTDGFDEKVKKTKVPPVDVPLDPDTEAIPEKTRKTKVPPVKVPIDPLLAAFQQEVQRQTAALARSINADIPIGADTSKLRAELGADLARIQSSLKAKVPTEPDDLAGYQTKLRAELAAVAARVKQTVHVDVEVDKPNLGGGSGGGLGSFFSGLGRFLPGIGAASSGVSELSGAFQKLSGTSAQAGGQMAGAVQSAAGPIGTIVGALLAAAAAAAALSAGVALAVPVLGAMAAALTAVAGAAAAIPGALAGIGAGVGTLALGFQGISEAFKPKSGGGGGGGSGGGGVKDDPAARARRIAAAERGVDSARRGIAAATRGVASAERGYADALRGVTEAEKSLAKAQAAVSKARKEAKEDIEDLGRALRGAVLDEESATQAVADAALALSEAQQTGNIPEIKKADIAYRQAQLTLENAKDSVQDLGEEQAKSAKVGVEGSDKVVAALEDQDQALESVRKAHDGVIDAQSSLISANDGLKASYDGLKSAQEALVEAQKKTASAGGGGGGGGGFGAEVIKLAPAAQKFVDAVKALKPAFENLRLDVQQKLFAGLDKTVTRLGDQWIPALHTTLGAYATTFNGFFKTLGANISTDTFIGRIQTAAEGARKGLDSILKAVSGPLVTAFGQLAEKSAPFLEKIGDVIAKIVVDFSAWIDKSYKTGKLESFFETASKAVDSLGVTVGETARLIGNLFAIIFRGNGKNDKSAVDSFNDGLRSINVWLEDPANQNKIAEWLDRLKGTFDRFKQNFKFFDDLLAGDKDAATKADSIGQTIGRAVLSGMLAGLKGGIKDAGPDSIIGFFGPLGLVKQWKDILGIHSPSTVMMEVGRDTIEGFKLGIQEKFPGVAEKGRQLKSTLSTALGDAKAWLRGPGQRFADGLRDGLNDRLASLRSKAVQLKTTISGALSDARSNLITRGLQFADGLAQGIQARYPSLYSRALGLKTSIGNALSGAGNLLYGIGQTIINGLINGFNSMIGNLGSTLANITNYIAAHKGPIDKDRKLLAPAGAAIMEGLIGGIASSRGALGSELAAVTDQIAKTTVPDIGAELAAGANLGFGSLQAQMALAAPEPARQPELAWAKGTTGDKFLDALTDRIELRFRGSPALAFSKR